MNLNLAMIVVSNPQQPSVRELGFLFGCIALLMALLCIFFSTGFERWEMQEEWRNNAKMFAFIGISLFFFHIYAIVAYAVVLLLAAATILWRCYLQATTPEWMRY